MSEHKSMTRREYLERRRALSPAEVKAKSAAIHSRLDTLPEVQFADSLLCYVSSKDNEVDTLPLITAFLERGARLLVPIARRDGELDWSHLIALEELAPSRFGILEPAPEFRRIVAAPDDAPVLVPGIAFTRDGWRIGYGGGFFDRFLAHHKGPAIALAFDVQLMDAFTPEPHDIPMQIVVTETATYRRAASNG